MLVLPVAEEIPDSVAPILYANFREQAARDRSGKAIFDKFVTGNKGLSATKFAQNEVSGSISRLAQTRMSRGSK